MRAHVRVRTLPASTARICELVWGCLQHLLRKHSAVSEGQGVERADWRAWEVQPVQYEHRQTVWPTPCYKIYNINERNILFA